MKIKKKSALLVIDVQNKYKNIVTSSKLKNIKMLVEKFKDKDMPVYFTQWSRCKYRNNCTRKHKRETIINKISVKNSIKWGRKWYLEKKKSYKCPSKNCDLLDELKPFSNSSNTFISNNMDALYNKKLHSIIKKKNIKYLYLVGGWGTMCILGTAYGCINYHNIMPYIVIDAVFDPRDKQNKVTQNLVNVLIPGCNTKDIM